MSQRFHHYLKASSLEAPQYHINLLALQKGLKKLLPSSLFVTAQKPFCLTVIHVIQNTSRHVIRNGYLTY
jgi:hypothetical protein